MMFLSPVTPESSKMRQGFEPYSQPNVIVTPVPLGVVSGAAPVIDPQSLSVVLGVHEYSLGIQTVHYKYVQS